MFSCCRANPEKDSSIKQKNKKDKQKKNTEPEQSTENNDKKLIIPTITIENGGKLNDGDTTETPETPDSDVSGGAEVAKSVDESEVKCENNDDDVLINQIDTNAVIEKFKDRAENPPEDALDESNCQGNEDVTRVTVSNFIANSDGNSPISTNEQHLQSKSSLGTTSTDDTNSTVIMQKIPTSTAATSSLPSNTVDISQSDSFAESNSNQNDKHSLKHHHHQQNNTNNIHQEVTPKSCLSRHNSTHVSIKKKVNICNHAEIIEPDPLPPPPYDHPSLADDDDVFSDSLPPPKRESMCAPYIERDDDPETLVAFAHGLPEWFNDERINDTGCVEPPVTPVGRDELEMKRHRLYSELLRAAHAAVEHSVRFDTLGPEVYTYSSAMTTAAAASDKTGDDDEDCDPDLKPSVAENLEHLVNRLERLVERLERSISARELEIANKTFDSVLVKKRESFDLETTDLPPIPPIESSLSEQLTQQTGHLNQRIERIETTLNKLNDSYSNSQRSSNASQSSQQQKQFLQQQSDGSLENIPTVLEDYQTTTEEDSLPLPPPPQQLELSMSVLGYQDIVAGPFSQYLSLSAKIGGDVAKQANLVKSAFDAQLKYVTLATQCSQPSQDKQMDLLKPTSTQISAIQDYREKNRASPFFNHLSAISESIPALGWVCVAPTPGPHVKEMNDAGQFYTNRVLKEWKEKDTTHVEWARAWIQTLTELQQYIKQYHTTGLVWSGKGPIPAGGAAKPPPPPPIGSCPPPPPPPAFDLAAMSLDGEERNALFAEINQGEAITKNLKRVTADMQTHKNPTLRTGPAPFKAPTQTGGVGGVASKPAAAKEPVFTRDGKKWLIEHQKNNPGLLVENAEMNNVVYVFKCEGSTITVKGKVNNIVLDSCKKCSLLFDSVVASIEFVNCQSVQMQVLGFVPTVIIDKTDGCQMYLSNESLGIEIVSSKSSEMNVMLPATSGDYTELAVPEQYKTTISGKTLKTVCVDSLG